MRVPSLFILSLSRLQFAYSSPPPQRRTAPNLYLGATIRCYGDGANLSGGQTPSQPVVADCYEAGRRMPWDRDPTITTTFTRFPNVTDTVHVPASWTYRTCSIGIDLSAGQGSGRATWQKLGEVAMQVLRTCVESGLRARAGGTGVVGLDTGMQISVCGVDVDEGGEG
ncbi:hypothetical protein MMC14_005108 [Varicellaria rhodocarpa]|nr:hypothetical protein [Varicellaria rhodocarpa]